MSMGCLLVAVFAVFIFWEQTSFVTALGSIHDAVADELVRLEVEKLRTLSPFWTLSDNVGIKIGYSWVYSSMKLS